MKRFCQFWSTYNLDRGQIFFLNEAQVSNDEAMGVPNGVEDGSISCKVELKVDLPIYGQVYAQELRRYYTTVEKKNFGFLICLIHRQTTKK